MERSEDHGDLTAALAEVRPAPRAAFAAELDERVAAGFPRDSRSGRSPLVGLTARIPTISPRRLLFAGGGTALAALAVAVVVVAGVNSGSRSAALEQHAAPAGRGTRPPVQSSKEIPEVSGQTAESGLGAGSSGSSAEAETLHSLSGSNATYAPLDRAFRPFSRTTHRQIERSADVGLLAEPADIADDSARVFSAVHDANGIVLHSTTTAGKHAGADFDLLIPSARLGDALAAFSAIDEVRSRHEATADITAPTVTVTERLRDSQAKIDGLLAQLSTAETQSESEAIESELRDERQRTAGLRSQLSGLNRRADFSRVSLKIETGATETGPGGGWGIDDALGDAGHILAVAGGVTLVALAVIAPIALILFLAWLAQRLWRRARRERALDA